MLGFVHAAGIQHHETLSTASANAAAFRDQRCCKAFGLCVAMAIQSAQLKQDVWWSGLHLEWDDCLEVRGRIRDGAKLMLPNPCMGNNDGSVDRSIHNCRFNKHVLLPALRRWKNNGPDSSPSIDNLYDEVAKLYRICLRSDVTASDIYRDAWALRKLMGLVKAQLSKQAVPQVAWSCMIP